VRSHTYSSTCIPLTVEANVYSVVPVGPKAALNADSALGECGADLSCATRISIAMARSLGLVRSDCESGLLAVDTTGLTCSDLDGSDRGLNDFGTYLAWSDHDRAAALQKSKDLGLCLVGHGQRACLTGRGGGLGRDHEISGWWRADRAGPAGAGAA
jgi:hypothetical protein